MRLLLDTHIFIWWTSDPTRLSASAHALCADEHNTLVLSLVSVWEMQVKAQLGKLKLNSPLPDLIAGQQDVNGLQILLISLAHIYELEALENHHRDPFDRLLIAQARIEAMPIVTADDVFQNYEVTTLG